MPCAITVKRHELVPCLRQDGAWCPSGASDDHLFSTFKICPRSANERVRSDNFFRLTYKFSNKRIFSTLESCHICGAISICAG